MKKRKLKQLLLRYILPLQARLQIFGFGRVEALGL